MARFGPVNTATGWPGISSLVTSLIRLRELRSIPFVSVTTGTHGRRNGAASAATSRYPCDGTAITSTSAWLTASSNELVARNCSGNM